MEIKKQVKEIQDLIDNRENLDKTIYYHKGKMEDAREEISSINHEINMKLIEMKYNQ